MGWTVCGADKAKPLSGLFAEKVFHYFVGRGNWDRIRSEMRCIYSSTIQANGLKANIVLFAVVAHPEVFQAKSVAFHRTVHHLWVSQK